ncbi:MAG: hypothetical protein LWW81_15650 [Rhodocyclales bacterium]|nr:hypothetical protein [Rhodocyclales bacterium]
MKQVINVSTIRGNMKRFKGHAIPLMMFVTASRCAGCKHPAPAAGVCNGSDSVTPY